MPVMGGLEATHESVSELVKHKQRMTSSQTLSHLKTLNNFITDSSCQQCDVPFEQFSAHVELILPSCTSSGE